MSRRSPTGLAPPLITNGHVPLWLKNFKPPKDDHAVRSQHDPEYADWRKHVAYGGPYTYAQYRELREFWRTLGGAWFGPNVEHGSISEQKLLPLLDRFRRLVGA